MSAPSHLTGDDAVLFDALRLLDQDPVMVARKAREILSRSPRHADARLILGMSCNASGEHAEALDVLEPLVREYPEQARPWLELGLALVGAGRREPAAEALYRAIGLQPALPGAWLALAELRYADGDGDGANAAYMEHLHHSQHDQQLMNVAAALAQARLPEAEQLLRCRLGRWPGDVAAMRLLAELCIRLRRNEEAIELLERALERAPDFDAARQNYVVALNRASRHADALQELDTLLEKTPNDQVLHDMKAVILGRLGDVNSAIATYESVLKRQVGEPQIWLGYGNALKTAGRTADAIGAYRRAISLQPGFAGAWWSLSNLKTVRFDDADVAAMRAQLQRDDLDDTARLHFEFALGKALEDAGAYAAAFTHYASGNALRRKQLPYDYRRTREETRNACRVYDRGFFAARSGVGCPAPDPVFVLGMPRSGSTLVEQILSSHWMVESTAELTAIPAIAHDLKLRADATGTASYHDMLMTLEAGELRALGERYLQRTRVQRREDTPLFIDKMPNNFAHVGLIHLVLPSAKIIDVRRHPLACCFSNFKQHFGRGQAFSYDLADMGHYYRDYVALMAHFDEVLPGRVHRVIYEELVTDTETQVRRLLDYCGLEFDERCLRFFENRRAVRTASSEQVRRPIYREGVDHWRHFEPWLGPLKEALGPVLPGYPAVPAELVTRAEKS